ncbi:MAG: Alcohol dehydrogenase GroES domain protein [Verrucomicrobia bacterium]|nr:Alcohol dehydrogenase GroES domain protein [Verrucomicrobiota bacterium]
MQTLTLTRPGELRLTDTPAPSAPGAGESLVRVRASGVCGTDLHAFGGKQPFFTYPRIPGHELGVEVLAVGLDVTNVRVGDRCAVEPYLNCGRCIACRKGKTNCCETLQVLGVHVDGGWREEIIVPAAKLHRSAQLTFEQLALVETLGIGAHAVTRGDPTPGESTLVIGAGPIGLAVAQFAAVAGAKVTMLDVNDARRAFAADWLGVATLEARNLTPEKLRAELGGELPTLVFDATGSPASMRQSFLWPAQGGRMVFASLVQGEIAFDDPNFHRRELTLLSTRNSTAAEFKRIIALMESGRIDTAPWVTHRATIEEVPAVFASWTKPETGVVKAMIQL